MREIKIKMIKDFDGFHKKRIYDAVYVNGDMIFAEYPDKPGMWHKFTDKDAGVMFKTVMEVKAERYRHINIPQEQVDFLNKLMGMTGQEIYDVYGLKRDETFTYGVKFDNGICADIRVIICDEGDEPYAEGVMFDNGSEVFCTECEDTIEGIWEFRYDGQLYVVEIGIEKDKKLTVVIV